MTYRIDVREWNARQLKHHTTYTAPTEVEAIAQGRALFSQYGRQTAPDQRLVVTVAIDGFFGACPFVLALDSRDPPPLPAPVGPPCVLRSLPPDA